MCQRHLYFGPSTRATIGVALSYLPTLLTQYRRHAILSILLFYNVIRDDTLRSIYEGSGIAYVVALFAFLET